MGVGSDDLAKETPGVIAPPPLIYVCGLALAFLCDWMWPVILVPGGVQYAVGAPLIVLGLAIVVRVFIRFRKAGTNIEPYKPTTALITDGLYRYSRNPVYVALTAIYTGIGVVANTAWVLPMLVPTLWAVRYGVIAREERYLDAKFGDEYRRYTATVRRWI